MNQDEIRKILQKELMRISNLAVQQSEKSMLVAQALEQYRQAGNRIRRVMETEEQRRVQGIMGQFKKEQEVRNLQANKAVLKAMAGTELFDSFVKKFIKEKK